MNARLARLLLAALSLALAGSGFAQQYPTKPVRIIVPFPPGQATDILARLLADQLSKSLGQQFIAENRAGAGGSVGTEVAAKAAPDGYTLVMATIATFGINPSLYPKLGYVPLRDFAPICEPRADAADAGREPEVGLRVGEGPGR